MTPGVALRMRKHTHHSLGEGQRRVVWWQVAESVRGKLTKWLPSGELTLCTRVFRKVGRPNQTEKELKEDKKHTNGGMHEGFILQILLINGGNFDLPLD